MKYYLSIEKNIEVFELYKPLWKKYGINAVRADTMTEGIEKGIEIENSKTDELYFIDIVADDVDFMAQLQILSEQTSAPILIATNNFNGDERTEALAKGADYYGQYEETTKQNIDSVIAAINSIKRRAAKSMQSIELIFYEKILISPEYRQVFINDKEAGLTKTEFDVLYFLASNVGYVKTFEQIYDHVWGEDVDKSVIEAVKSVIKKLRHKIGGYIESVRGVGYRLPIITK